MKAVRQTLIAACLAASMTVMAAPAVAGGAGEHRSFPDWFFHLFVPSPLYPVHVDAAYLHAAHLAYSHYGAATCCQRGHRRLGWYEYYYGPRN